jgi:hypothetical protein
MSKAKAKPRPSRTAASSPIATRSAARRKPGARAAAATPAASKKRLAPALARRASALHAVAQARLVKQGREAIALIRERRADIAENYFDVGQALVTLKSDAMAAALAYDDVATMLREELDLSVATADKLIELATRVDRSVLRELRQERAAAILALVDATPEDDRVEDLLAKPFPVAGRAPLDLRTAPVAAIRDVARAIRQRRAPAPGKRAEGFTTTPAQRATFAALTTGVQKDRALRGLATFKLIASRAAHGPIVEARIALAHFASVVRRLAARGR